MFNIKRIIFLIIGGLSGISFMASVVYLFFIFRDILKNPSDNSIFLLAWPFVLAILLSGIFSFIIMKMSIMQINKIDESIVSSKKINKVSQVALTPIVKFGLVFFGVITLIILLGNILK